MLRVFFIEAKISLARIAKFLEEPELQKRSAKSQFKYIEQSIVFRGASFSRDINSLKATLDNIDLNIKAGENVVICGEVGSGKSTLLVAILREVPSIKGMVSLKCFDSSKCQSIFSYLKYQQT